MPRIALFNMMFGFGVLFFAAAAGVFLSQDITSSIIHDEKYLTSWVYILKRSAHAHTNLFGMLHVLFGLTLPYSELSSRCKYYQTIGLVCGTVAMAVGLLLQAWQGPKDSIYDLIGLFMGLLLGAALLTLISHASGIYMKFSRKS